MADNDFSFEITEHIVVLSESNTGWLKELNRVSWNGKEPVYDIRAWSPDHQKMAKGVTLNESEMKKLKECL